MTKYSSFSRLPSRLAGGLPLQRAAFVLLLLPALMAQAQGLKPSTQLRTPELATVRSASAGAVTGQRAADYIVAVVNSEIGRAHV